MLQGHQSQLIKGDRGPSAAVAQPTAVPVPSSPRLQLETAVPVPSPSLGLAASPQSQRGLSVAWLCRSRLGRYTRQPTPSHFLHKNHFASPHSAHASSPNYITSWLHGENRTLARVTASPTSRDSRARSGSRPGSTVIGENRTLARVTASSIKRSKKIFL